MNETSTEAKKPLELISASDIEKYGYCPLSWYLHHKDEREGAGGDGSDIDETAKEALGKGEALHRKAGEDMGDIIRKQGSLESTNISWIAFVVIAVMLAANGALLILLIAFEQDNSVLGPIIAATAVLWMIVAIYYFISLLLTERRMKLPFLRILKLLLAPPPKRPEKKARFAFKREALKMAVILISIAAVLIFNSSFYLLGVDRKIWQNILIVLSLVWMLGTSVHLFISLRAREQDPPYRNKMLIGFTVVGVVGALGAAALAVTARLLDRRHP